METLSDTDSFPLIKTFFASAAAVTVLSVRQLRPHACVWPLQTATLAPLSPKRLCGGLVCTGISLTMWQFFLGTCAPVVFCFGTDPRMCIIVLPCHFSEHPPIFVFSCGCRHSQPSHKPHFEASMCLQIVLPFAPVRVLCALHSGRKTRRSAVVLLTMFLSQPAAASTQGHDDQTSPSDSNMQDLITFWCYAL